MLENETKQLELVKRKRGRPAKNTKQNSQITTVSSMGGIESG